MNAYFQLETSDNGTFLLLYPATDGGNQINVNEVAEYLNRKNVVFEITMLNREIKDLLTEKRVKLDSLSRLKERELMSFTVNAMKLMVIARFYPPSTGGVFMTREDIINDLKARNVNWGYDYSIIDRFLHNREYCTDYIIARGTLPKQGHDASIEYFFNTSLKAKPTLNDDGSVDFFHLNSINHCKKGMLLAKLNPEYTGEPGMNVCGEIIRPADVRRVSIKYGRNIRITEDRTEIYSEVDGHVSLVDDKVFVSNVYQVENVDNATGNIEYEGSVVVSGNVCSNFEIKAKGNIEVRGVVEGAKLEADGDIIITRGMNGMGKGSLKAGGNIVSKFIENAVCVLAGGYIETESILHSKVMAGTEINVVSRKGFIAGGVVCATNLVQVKTLGSQMGSDTVVEIGVDPTLKTRHQELMQRMDTANKNMRQIQPVLNAMKQKLVSGGRLLPEQMKNLKDLATTSSSLQKQIEEDSNEIADIEIKLDSETNAQVIVNGVVYAGTKISISGVSMVVKEDYKYCRFIKLRGEVKMTSL